jgi:hypothetical protein
MGYRGRLIKPVMARIYLLDTAATQANAGGFPHGYDPIFKEKVKNVDGTNSRVESAPVELRCQVRGQLGDYARLNMGGSGHHSEFNLVLIFYRHDLETAGLIETANGECRLRVNCRVDRLLNLAGNTLRVYDRPQLFCTEVQDRGIGFDANINLLQLKFEERETTTKEALW